MKYKEGFTICILNKDTLEFGHSQFKKNTNYRVSFDEDLKGCIVFGEWMTIRQFEKNFELYIPILQERLKRLDLIREGQPIPFKEFKTLGNIVGRGYINMYLYNHPKENMFAFYPRGTSTKAKGIKACYDLYVDLVNGGWENVDSGEIRWGNCGLPLSGYPRREELWDEHFKKQVA